MRSFATELREAMRLRVIYGDTDCMGIVYYANYLRYFEAARSEYLRQRGYAYRTFEEQNGLHLPVVEAHVEYKRPARYDDELVIFAAIEPLGPASARFRYEIHRVDDGTLVARGHTVHACVTAAGKVVRIPDEMRDALGWT